MKAYLLAAGLGTRLKPITDSTPKCLVNICGKPLLGWWIDLFQKHQIDEVLINLHHLPEQVIAFIESYNSDVRFKFFYEEQLLGSGGTLRQNKDFVKNESSFFICYADNLTNYNLTEFLNFHKSKMSDFSISLFKTDQPTAKGIALLDSNNVIIDFEEKPKIPKSELANAGIYISSPKILELIPEYERTDIGFQLLPKLVGKMTGWKTSDYLIDIGTHQDLGKAETEWRKIIREENEL
jgi:mannose-1-phosphate guanylyltransferase